VAEPSEVLHIIENLREQQRWASHRLKEMQQSVDASRRWRVQLALVMLNIDQTRVADLVDYLTICQPPEFSPIIAGLRPYESELAAVLLARLRDNVDDAGKALRTACALAELGVPSRELVAYSSEIVAALVLQNPLHLLVWTHALHSIADRLIPPLRKMMIGENQYTGIREACALVLLEFSQKQPSLLAAITAETTLEIFPIVFERLQGLRCEDTSEVLNALDTIVVSTGQEAAETGATESVRIINGRRRAVAASVMLRLGGRPRLATLLDGGGSDPEAATQFVHQVRQRGVSADVVARELLDNGDALVRYWLILAMGAFSPDDVSADLYSSVRGQLPGWYATDTSAAVHSVAGWLARTWGHGAAIREIDEQVVPFVSVGDREWFSIATAVGPMRFVRIRSGKYTMGCTLQELGAKPYETPPHRVALSRDFAMSVGEVTRNQYEMFVRDTNHVALPNIDDWSPTLDHPVVGLTWFEAGEYLSWLWLGDGYVEGPSPFRLPTEAEWEYACRADSTTAFSFGSDRALLPEYGWFQENSDLQTHSNLTLRPNRFGLHNMHGNTWEWCSDWYGSYNGSSTTDPVGAPESDWRVLRGGCWNLNERYSRSACRNWHIPTNRNWYIGLRVSLTLPAPAVGTT